jgi:hypothetical protein
MWIFCISVWNNRDVIKTKSIKMSASRYMPHVLQRWFEPYLTPALAYNYTR